MKVHGWRAMLAAGAMVFGTTALAGGDKAQQGAELDQEEKWQQGMGGSGSSQGEVEMESESGTGGSGSQQGQMGSQMESQTAQSGVSGDVVEKKGDVVFLRLEQGAIIPVKVNNQTQATLSEKDGQLKGQQAVKKLNVGDKVNVELKSEKGSNIAQSIELDQSKQSGQELQGRVASVQGNWINIEHDSGALVPLKVDKKTEFQGQSEQGQQVSSVRQLKAGQEVRASFRAEGTTNAAESIEVTGGSQGMGGSGEQGFEQPQPIEEPMPSQPSEPSQPSQPSEPFEPGTGGSGTDGSSMDQTLPTEPSEDPMMIPPTQSPDAEQPSTGGNY